MKEIGGCWRAVADLGKLAATSQTVPDTRTNAVLCDNAEYLPLRLARSNGEEMKHNKKQWVESRRMCKDANPGSKQERQSLTSDAQE